uniref:Reverse transcriptase domain-containing protein n=1 Tax=Tanacetum cinerariifolium TaxID=118510 RepID=A0A6L2JHZ1_TANCI|nr:hypothetical protein [Tanacetum cinerariifolium]
MNQNFYNSNSSGFDQSQPLQSPVIHPPPQETSIEILRDQENAINYMQTFLRKFNRIFFFKTPKVLLLAWDRVFKIKDALENKQYKPEDIQELLRKLFNDVQNIHEELAEYINTPRWNCPAFCNNGDDDDEDCTIVVTPDFLITDSLIMDNEYLDTILKTESDEFIKSSVENLVSIPRVIHEMSFKTYSNPLFDLDEEIISSEFNPIHNEELDSTPKNDCFDTDSYLLESSLNRDTLMISSLKIYSLLTEFVGELIFLESIPPIVDEANCDPEEDIHLVERLLYDNSSPRPPKEFVYENSNADIESFSLSSIPIKDSDSHIEEIDLTFTPDDPMPPSIEDDDNDSERDILILEELPSNYSLSLLEIFQPSAKYPMMIHGKNILDVPLFHFYPLDQFKYGGNWVKLSDLKQALRGRHPMLIRSLVLVMNNYSRKFEDSCQRILSSKSSFPQLQLRIQYPNLID